MALLRQGDCRAGYRELVRAVDLKPDFIKARYQFALMHAVSNDTKRAKEEWKRFASRTKTPKRPITWRRRSPWRKTARQRVERARGGAKQGAQSGIDLFRYGHRFIWRRRISRRESRHYRKALEIDPKFYPRAVALAQLYAATGKQDQAEQELLLATKADPENEELLHVLGVSTPARGDMTTSKSSTTICSRKNRIP